VLRNDLDLNGPRFGCGLGQCGACSVLIDGNVMRSCLIPVASVRNTAITTLEGLGQPDSPHPVQAAFLAEQAAQCGYCSNGMILAAAALLERNPAPSDTEIRQALEGHLCRCGSHTRILRAVRRAAAMLA
jgi:nicotinate dehydrogenase subunit A